MKRSDDKYMVQLTERHAVIDANTFHTMARAEECMGSDWATLYSEKAILWNIEDANAPFIERVQINSLGRV